MLYGLWTYAESFLQFLKNPGKYKSVSAYAPIANPTKCQWGQKAFSGYLNNESEWSDYDATELVKKWNGGPLDVLIDVVSLLSYVDVVCSGFLPFAPAFGSAPQSLRWVLTTVDAT